MLTSATTSDKEFGRNPIGPKGCGGTAPLPLSLLLANAHTLTRRRFAEIGAVALATIAMLFRKRATSTPINRVSELTPAAEHKEGTGL